MLSDNRKQPETGLSYNIQSIFTTIYQENDDPSSSTRPFRINKDAASHGVRPLVPETLT